VRCPGSTWEPTPRVASGVLIALMLVVPSAVMQTAVHSVHADTPLKSKVAGVPGWFSTYLGGRGNDAGVSVAVDAHDNVYVAGTTQSTNFPTVHAIQGTNHFRRGLDTLEGTGSAFVTAMSPAGRIIYSTYLGGRNGELTTGITVDRHGNAFIVGDTYSTDFPTLHPVQTACQLNPQYSTPCDDAFVTKLDPTGRMAYSTYIGGTDQEHPAGIAVNSRGEASIVGSTSSADFPTIHALQAHWAPGGSDTTDVFVTTLSASGNRLVFSTYLGRHDDNEGYGIAVDGKDNLYLTGTSDSTDFAGAVGRHGPGNDSVFVAKITAAHALAYVFRFGGSPDESAGVQTTPHSITVDPRGEVVIAGTTSYPSFPVAHALQRTLGGGD
jgi:hypothetical protein